MVLLTALPDGRRIEKSKLLAVFLAVPRDVDWGERKLFLSVISGIYVIRPKTCFSTF